MGRRLLLGWFVRRRGSVRAVLFGSLRRDTGGTLVRVVRDGTYGLVIGCERSIGKSLLVRYFL
jgi:hypothetical protein